MSNILEYKGYQGSVEFSAEDDLFFGKVLFINDSLMFHGASVVEIRAAFHEVIDDYLIFCKQKGGAPDQPFKGTFNVRIGPELHRTAAITAAYRGINLNELIKQAVAEKVGSLIKADPIENIQHRVYHVTFQAEIGTHSNEILMTNLQYNLSDSTATTNTPYHILSTSKKSMRLTH